MPEPIKRLMVAFAMLRVPSTTLVPMVDAYQGTYRLRAVATTREEVRDYLRTAAHIAEAGITTEEVTAWIESRAKRRWMMPEPILCPECGHDIDEHRPVGCMHVVADTISAFDDCTLSATEIARAYADERFREGWDACELRWAVGHSE